MALTRLLDTSVFSQPIRNFPVESAMDRWHHAVCTSALCLEEVKQGLECRQSKKYRQRYEELLRGHYPILSFDENTATVYAQLVAELKKCGTPKPTADLLIASTAKQHGLILATLKAKDFEGIPGVAVEDWG